VDIENFFETNKKIKLNENSKHIPTEFSDWNTNDHTCELFYDWIRAKSDVGSLKLNIPCDAKFLAKEISAKIDIAFTHRSETAIGWRSIVLHGMSSIMSDYKTEYIEKGIIPNNAVEDWTDVSKYFPYTVEWIKEVMPFNTYERIRIMVLDAGGKIYPHKDLPQSTLSIGINVAITHPNNIEYAVENSGLIPWKEGDVRVINVGKLHSVRNFSHEPRIHLLVYPQRNEKWNLEGMRLVCKGYEQRMVV